MTTHLINAPFGFVSVAIEANQLLVDLLPQRALPPLSSFCQPREIKNTILRQACEQIEQYLKEASQNFSQSLCQQAGTAFQKRVWQAIVDIPLGQTASYEQIAKKIGSGSRAVANACGANKIPLIVPCHRVVAKNGLGGFMQGCEDGSHIKRWLLAHENVSEYQ